MVKVKWMLGRGKVYIAIIVSSSYYYYCFPKIGHHKRFHPRQIFTRNISFNLYNDSLIKYMMEEEECEEGWLEDKIVRDKLGILVLTEEEYYDQIAKAC